MAVKVHQALHGYSEGHRQLACSTVLSPRDARLLLVMSDVSGPGVASTGLSYVTGYPLVESGSYALSMTWPAPELPRPGCVWTHTLLISFADLAVLDVPSALAALFIRPSDRNLTQYESAVNIKFSIPFREPLSQREARSLKLLADALYGHPNEQIWAQRPYEVDVDDVVLRIWDQQWPRLRRSFKFCSLTSRDRSQDPLQFDLQLTPSGNSNAQLQLASNLSGYEATESSDNDAWLIDLVHDAERPARSSLRQMLRRLGADVLGGREAMRPICSLHSALQSRSPLAIPIAMTILQEHPPLSASDIAKSMVVLAALDRNDPLDHSDVLAFLIANFELLTEADARARTTAFSRAVWRADPRVFIVNSFDGGDRVRTALRAGLSSIDREEVFNTLPKFVDLAEPLLELLPELASDQRYWAETQSWPTSMASLGIDLSRPEVLKAMVQGLHDEGAINSCLHIAGTPAVLACLEDLLRSEYQVPQLQRWIRQACVDLPGVAFFLSHSSHPTKALLLLITEALHPDTVPNDYGEDPWCIAFNNLRELDGSLPVELCAYGFRRAFSWRSKSVEQLLQLTFEVLHDAALQQSIPESSWKMLEGALPWTLGHESWDHALRLRRATAKKSVDLPVQPESFVSFVNSDDLFADLLVAVWHLWNGPRYLKEVVEKLQNSKQKSLHRREKLIKAFIKNHSLW